YVQLGITSICYLFTRIQSRSTLLPYTTLFRSADGIVDGVVQRRFWVVGGTEEVVLDPVGQAGHPDTEQAHPAAGVDLGQQANREDRKSTRLNSSHVKNSYAVFCLKKKKYS